MSIAEAARDTKLNETTIRNNCEGRTRWAKNYTNWEYVDETRTENARIKVKQEREMAELKRQTRPIKTVSNYVGEIWKPVPYKGYEELYSISNMGRLKSNRMYEDEKIIKPIILKKQKERTEETLFMVNNLYNNNEVFNISIPKTVAEVFVPNPTNYTNIRHKDGNKLNCKADNLEWYDPTDERSKRSQENYYKYLDHQAHRKKPVRCIETGYEFDSIVEAGRFMGMEPSYIGLVCNGKGTTCGGYHWEFVDKKDSYNPKIQTGEQDIRKIIDNLRKSQ